MARILTLIADAEQTLSLIFYIFGHDPCSLRIVEALEHAARRGVAVRLMLDSFGSSTTPDTQFSALRAAGGSVQWFSGSWGSRYLIRNHQKLIVADGRIAMTGGFNIGEAYCAPDDDSRGWRDIGILIEGPTAALAARWARVLQRWMSAQKQGWRTLIRLIRRFHGGHGAIRLLVGGPTPRFSPWTRAIRQDLRLARRIVVSTAYFSPNTGVLRRLAMTTRFGGHTRLVLPAYSDNPATIGASRLLYGYLLKRGVEIAEFQAAMLHNKIYVLDNTVYIGSANLDMRSLYINLELMLRIEDAQFAQACRDVIAAQMPESTIITPQGYKARAGWINRLRWAASWLMVSVIDYGVTRRLNFGLPDRD